MRVNEKGQTALADTIINYLNYLREEDLNNDVYQVTLTPHDGDNISIAITNVSDLTGMNDKTLFGIIIGATHKPCLIVSTQANQSLLKQVFKKADGKQLVVQEYEFVEEVIHRDKAHIEGIWNATTHTFSPTTLQLNGTDLLRPSSPSIEE